MLRKYHRLLALFIAIQVLFWALTGLYMVAIDIHYIHGERWVKDQTSEVDVNQLNLSFSEVLNEHPTAQHISLRNIIDKPVYKVVDDAQQITLIDAISGAPLSPVTEQWAKQIALTQIAEPIAIESIQLLEKRQHLPDELSARHLPVWQITFEGVLAPTFYISQVTGELVTVRHTPWRIFDWMWRLHIMDYDDGENVANYLLTLFAIMSLLTSLLGLGLIYQRLIKPSIRRFAR